MPGSVQCWSEDSCFIQGLNSVDIVDSMDMIGGSIFIESSMKLE